MAERELGEFMNIIRDLYGPEQATISVEDWLDELESMGLIPGSTTTHKWRSITIAASVGLAKRLTGTGRHGAQCAQAALLSARHFAERAA